jgi:sucrose-6-phosphate hydrolase SacC (GH32 family)
MNETADKEKQMRHSTVSLVCVFCACACLAGEARQVPAFQPKGHNAWDFWFAKSGDTYHAFYLEYPDKAALPDQSRRHGGQWVGHAVSKDLVHWEEHPVALKEAPARGIATGSCVRDGDRWFMLLTYQGFTLAESDDLEHWRWKGRALFPSELSAVWKGEKLAFRLLADPYVYPEKNDGWWYAAINSQIVGVPKETSGAQVLMRSRDLLHWETHNVICYPRRFERIETSQMWTKNGRWYLHFGGAGGPGGSHVYVADRFDGPYEEKPWSRIELPRVGSFYLGKRVVAPDGGDVFLAGQGYAGLSLPQRMTYLPDGKILFGDETAIADFNGETYGDWTAEGAAFGQGPAHGTLPHQMRVEGFEGKGLVNSFFGGDGATGTLTSPSFAIERPYIAFLIGGGGWKDTTCMNLLVDGRVVRTATGPNVVPGGSEALEPASWDVSEFIGKTARLQIVDRATGCWGHINVDRIVACDCVPPPPQKNVTRTVTADQRWLLFPVKNGGKKSKVEVRSGADVLRFFDIELAEDDPDWWAPLDVGAWQGKTLTLWADKLSAGSKGLANVRTSDEAVPRDGLYREPLRPQLHFSPKRGWNNDPNGLVFFNGEYHLFFQHNPYGVNWGNMHWGHAVSTNLVHWTELDEALYPDALGPMFSGSAVVDRDNTSGFGRAGQPPLVLIYTAAGNPATQCIAYSLDGRTFTKYAGNPVVRNIAPGNRDPKVIWHAPTKRWLMALYAGQGEKHHAVHFLTSPNLREWSALSVVAGDSDGGHYLYECPDFFELPVAGDPASRWVLSAANGQYAIGAFDGTTFSPECERLRGHVGSAYYAAQTFSDLPNGRRVLIGWLQAASPGMSFNQGMTLPQELGLAKTAEGHRLTHAPVAELAALRTRSQRFGPLELTPGAANPLAGFASELSEVRLSCEVAPDAVVAVDLRGVPVRFDAAKQELTIGRHVSPWPIANGRLGLILYIDRTCVEAFSQDGLHYAPVAAIPDAAAKGLSIAVEKGAARAVCGEAFALTSCW